MKTTAPQIQPAAVPAPTKVTLSSLIQVQCSSASSLNKIRQELGDPVADLNFDAMTSVVLQTLLLSPHLRHFLKLEVQRRLFPLIAQTRREFSIPQPATKSSRRTAPKAFSDPKKYALPVNRRKDTVTGDPLPTSASP